MTPRHHKLSEDPPSSKRVHCNLPHRLVEILAWFLTEKCVYLFAAEKLVAIAVTWVSLTQEKTATMLAQISAEWSFPPRTPHIYPGQGNHLVASLATVVARRAFTLDVVDVSVSDLATGGLFISIFLLTVLYLSRPSIPRHRPPLPQPS